MAIKRGNPPGLKNVRATVYNHYVRVDAPKGLIFVSGQVSRDSEGNQVGVGSMLEQTRQCLRNRRAATTPPPCKSKPISEKNRSSAGVLACSALTSASRCDEICVLAGARSRLQARTPALLTMVEVNHLADPGLLVEITVIAAV